MKQYLLTPAAGKRLIAKAIAVHPAVARLKAKGRIVIVAGTTNGYVAEEILVSLGQTDGFSREAFFRGVTTPPRVLTDEAGRLPSAAVFPGDLVIEDGRAVFGKTIFDVVEELREGDLIIKGANCLDVAHKRVGVLIGHPQGGTVIAVLQAAVGRRVAVLVPVGLEKRVADDLDELARLMNAPGAGGFRMLPFPGEAFTELDAIALLCKARARLVAAGGIFGAEGAVWLAVEGAPDVLAKADALLRGVAGEAAFAV